MKQRKNNIFTVFLFLLGCNVAYGQAEGFIKTGINIGTINQEQYSYFPEIKYEDPLIRPIFGVGAQVWLSNNFLLRQEFMFQTKGQGTVRPDVRSGFQTSNPDVLRFFSFPLSIHRQLFSNFYLGLGFQPSFYLSGTDNYYAKDGWKGWIYGGIASLQFISKNEIEFGFEYDYDFNLYYCPGCDIRFYTYRFYFAYHLNNSTKS